MAEALGVASGVAGLITLADVVIGRLYGYIKHWKNEAKDAQRILVEIQSLMGILQGLRILELRVSKSALEVKTPAILRYQCGVTLEKIKDNLAETPQTATLHVQKLAREVTRHRRIEEIEDLLKDIERHKSAFNFAASMESLEAMLQTNSEQKEIAKDVKEIKDILLQIELTKETREVLEFFRTFDPEPSHATSVRLRSPGKGLWLIDSPEIESWRTTKNSKLWLSGIPGAGKTVLAGLLIQETFKSAGSRFGLAFYYCDYKNVKSRDVQNVLASLAGQLAMQSGPCFNILRRKYKPKDDGIPIQVLPDTQELSDLIREMAVYFDDIAIVVDALDESGDPGLASRTLCGLVQHTESNIKIAALSRDELEIKQSLGFDFVHIPVAARSGDLKIFVAAQIEERIRHKKLRIRSAELKDEILDRLVNGAEGM